MSNPSQIADVETPFSPLLKLNLPSPEEFRKRKIALISGEHRRSPSVLRTVLISLVTCRYHWAGWVVLVSIRPHLGLCLAPSRSCDMRLCCVALVRICLLSRRALGGHAYVMHGCGARLLRAIAAISVILASRRVALASSFVSIFRTSATLAQAQLP